MNLYSLSKVGQRQKLDFPEGYSLSKVGQGQKLDIQKLVMNMRWHEQGPLESGAPGEPVLMIMGLGASSRLWYRLLPWIARRHRALPFDNRGTGGSSAVRARLTMAGMADDAVSVLDAAGVASAHVTGA